MRRVESQGRRQLSAKLDGAVLKHTLVRAGQLKRPGPAGRLRAGGCAQGAAHPGHVVDAILHAPLCDLPHLVELRREWAMADIPEKRQILEIICLSFTLDGATLVPTTRKPFGVLAEGLPVQTGRGDWI